MTREIVYSILNDDQRKRFENDSQLDFAYAIPGVSRFRVNCFFQRGAISAVFRVIPTRSSPWRNSSCPGARGILRKPRGLVLVTGPTGSGKSTIAGGDDRLINSEREEHILTIEDPIEFLHRHKKCFVNQREIGADATRLRPRAEGRAATGPRRDPGRRDARPGDDLDRADRCRDGPPGVRDAAHPVDLQTVDRIIDVFPPHQQQQVRMQLSIALQGIVTQQLLPTADGPAGRRLEVLIPTRRFAT